MTDFWLGDIAVGMLTDKDTDISKEVVEKNFVDEPVQVYELTPNLESGSYSLVFNEEMHPRSESLSEQRDATLSMPDRHIAEFPFSMAGDEGHILVEQSNASITPSQMIDEGEISIRFMAKSDYRPAFKLNSSSFNDVFDIGQKSIVALPSQVQNVSQASDYQISSRDGALDLYEYSDRVILKYDRSEEYTSDERISPVRVYNSAGERIYSSVKAVSQGDYVENGIVRNTFQSPTVFDVYDNGWRQIGNVNLNVGDGYISEPSNYNTEIEFTTSDKVSLRKGFGAFRYTISEQDSFSFNSDETLTVVDDTTDSYRVVENSSNDQLVLLRTSLDGNFNIGSNVVEVTGLDVSKEYTFFFGVVPSEIAYSDYVEYLYNIGKQKRTLVQR